MEMPKVGAEHQRLLAFVGEWEGDEEVAATAWGPGGPAFGRMSFRADLDGFVVIQDYLQQRNSRVTFRGHGVFTVDPETKEILWYWFDSFGFPPGDPARGRFEDNVLTLIRTSVRGSSRYVYRIDAQHCHFSIENKLAVDSDFSPMVSGKYLRKD